MRVVIFFFGVALAATAHSDSLETCAGIDADTDRLACYDRLAGREAGEKAAAAAPAPTKAEATPQAEPEPETTPEDVFGKPPEEVYAAYAEATGVADVNEIRATVVTAGRDSRGHVMVELDNGQRWRQARKEYFKVSDGDEVVISKAVLGSYTMKRVSGGRGTKVRRTN